MLQELGGFKKNEKREQEIDGLRHQAVKVQ
jgi:hypothetical protein